MIGRTNARRGARRIFAVLQNRRLNQHIVYTIIDEVSSPGPYLNFCTDDILCCQVFTALFPESNINMETWFSVLIYRLFHTTIMQRTISGVRHLHEPAFSSEHTTLKSTSNSLISRVVVLKRLDVSVAVWQGVCGIQVGSLLVVHNIFLFDIDFAHSGTCVYWPTEIVQNTRVRECVGQQEFWVQFLWAN